MLEAIRGSSDRDGLQSKALNSDVHKSGDTSVSYSGGEEQILSELRHQLTYRKATFQRLSDELFGERQEYASKLEHLRALEKEVDNYISKYLDSMTQISLSEAELLYRGEDSQKLSEVTADLSVESFEDVESYRADLLEHLRTYQDSRKRLKELQSDCNRRTDSAHIESLNFVEFCKYAHSIQSNQLSRLIGTKTETSLQVLPSKQEMRRSKAVFEKRRQQSAEHFSAFYRTTIEGFQRKERILIGKCRADMEEANALTGLFMSRMRSAARDTATGETTSTTMQSPNSRLSDRMPMSPLDPRLNANSLENKVANSIIASMISSSSSSTRTESKHGGSRQQQQQSQANSSMLPRIRAATEVRKADSPEGRSIGTIRSIGRKTESTVSVGFSAEVYRGEQQTGPTGGVIGLGNRVMVSLEPGQSRATIAMRAADLALGIDKYNRSMANAKAIAHDGKSQDRDSRKDRDQSTEQQPVPSLTLTLQQQQQESSAAGRALFDAQRYLDCLDLEGLPQGALIEDRSSGSSPESTSRTTRSSAQSRSPAAMLSNVATQLCHAEGKFRQLNAIKEGLDIHLVKQANCLLLLAKDLHYELGELLTIMNYRDHTHTHMISTLIDCWHDG